MIARYGLFLAGASLTLAQPAPVARPTPPDLYGVYQRIPDSAAPASGLKNSGSPESLPLLPAAMEQAKSVNLKSDPWNMCQPVGPFRMMAREDTKIELIPQANMVVMLFEDHAHGLIRMIYTSRKHPEKLEPTWQGDSVGHWEGETFVVDTIGFNDRTWLNDHGAQHSDALHLVERIRQVLGGKYLEYRVTAEDPKTLAKPYTYTRYYKKLDSEILEDVCEDVP